MFSPSAHSRSAKRLKSLSRTHLSVEIEEGVDAGDVVIELDELEAGQDVQETHLGQLVDHRVEKQIWEGQKQRMKFCARN